ncbi:MAG TPA: hypothetical protein VG605_12330 [Puia sp.]|nr:hypothetical protein [Puia sp.]
MESRSPSLKELRADILLDFKRFLSGLDSGATNEQLVAILARIREKELQLIKDDGSMLAPEMWKLLHSRLANRKNVEIIDTTG